MRHFVLFGLFLMLLLPLSGPALGVDFSSPGGSSGGGGSTTEDRLNNAPTSPFLTDLRRRTQRHEKVEKNYRGAVMDAKSNMMQGAQPVDILGLSCFELKWKFFKLAKLLNGFGGPIASKIVGLVAAAVDGIIQKLVNYACRAVATAMNSALSAICLRLPKFDFGVDFGMKPTRQKSCTGWSLKDYMRVDPTRTSPFSPRMDFNYDMTRGIRRSTSGFTH